MVDTDDTQQTTDDRQHQGMAFSSKTNSLRAIFVIWSKVGSKGLFILISISFLWVPYLVKTIAKDTKGMSKCLG